MVELKPAEGYELIERFIFLIGDEKENLMAKALLKKQIDFKS